MEYWKKKEQLSNFEIYNGMKLEMVSRF